MTSATTEGAGRASFELTTVADDEVVLHWRSDGDGEGVEAHHDLAADAEVTFRGITTRTLPRPPGELLCWFATVNDVHFGERECGRVGDVHRIASHYLGFLGDIAVGAGGGGGDRGERGGEASRGVPRPPRRDTGVDDAGAGETPYPEMMSRSAATEIEAIGPAVVIAKGDLTAVGTGEEHAAFLDCYATAFGDRLVEVRGNHDVMSEDRFADPWREVVIDGAILAVLDTTIDGHDSGTLSPDQLEWLDELAARADRPVLVFGHHHAADPDTELGNANFFGIDPQSSKALVDLVARRTRIVAYFAGHTHRNRVRRFSASGDVPYVEVAAAKDFLGSWAEYRAFEGGLLQVHRRTSAAEALAWSERCRALYWGMYQRYSFGALADRCFPIWPSLSLGLSERVFG